MKVSKGVAGHLQPEGLLGLLAALLCPGLVESQFGGAGYTPPAPICPAFKCADGEMAVGNPDHQIWSYGCKDSGMNILNAASFDPNNPYANMGQKSVDKCCVERDICKQTCGMTSKACHDNFQKCSQKICKGDQNCQLQAMMSDIMSEPYDDEDKDKKYDPERAKCKGYNRGQQESCRCVPKKDFKSAVESNLKGFYSKFNSEKLDKKGDIKDKDEVWKKWKGKEPDMFMALAAKYKSKAVEIRQKPKPPPYKPPADTDFEDTAGTAPGEDESMAAEEATAADSETAPTSQDVDPEEAAFDQKLAAIQAKKQKAKEEEDYDAAADAKEEAADLIKEEIARLNSKKAKAIEEEDYLEAKRIKMRIQKHSELEVLRPGGLPRYAAGSALGVAAGFFLRVESRYTAES
eukprot:CAMPEP_0115428368 /NCGR_PEP_ID=MMETSP0271-20121206/29942_1 /TAXON_ID=71861 /ORGANISM="Scrippsiella trochoidea, Strain CCMP3099" /LENGTH=404 /DNA_ID=CAMNT_0002853461 /DNA_START=64 /DNA_END=1276 /DNA_ORIENTATION=-